MIKAEEFRLGNLVYCKGKIDKLTRVEDNNYCTENCGHGVWNDDLEPIVLTEEILLRCGFEKHLRAYKLKNFGKFMFSPEMGMSFYPAGNLIGLLKNDHIKHLHQLQNLYFALTGKELEVTL